MVLLTAIALLFASFIVVEVVKHLYTSAKDRSDDRVMSAYLRREEARYHAQNLSDIERIRNAAAAEMVRVAAEARGDVIEGTAREVRRR